MRKAWQLLLAVGIGLIGGSAPVKVQAILGSELTTVAVPPTTSSNVQVNVAAGGLALVTIPDLVFAHSSVQALIHGAVTLPLASVPLAKLVVQDDRGMNTGWSLTGELAAFVQTAPASQKLLATTVMFTQTTATGTNAAGIRLRAADFSGAPATLVNAPAGRGSGTTTITVIGAELVLPQMVTVQAGDYQAPLTWTLAAQPEPTS